MSKEAENRFIAGAQAPKQVHPFLSGPKSIAKLDRRQFLKLMAIISGGIAIAPWVPSGGFLLPPGPSVLFGGNFGKQKIANVSDPSIENKGPIGDQDPDGGRSLFFLYPDNSDPELTNVLVHLQRGQTSPDGSQWVAYNRTCIHLRCLVPYVRADDDRCYQNGQPAPDTAACKAVTVPRGTLHCPCHGSVYRVLDGVPIAGPAHNDPALGRPIPKVVIEGPDSNGDIFATGIVGQIGYGRTS